MSAVLRNAQFRATAFAHENAEPDGDRTELWESFLASDEFGALVQLRAYEESWLTEALAHAELTGDWAYVQREWRRHMEKHLDNAVNEYERAA